MREVHAQGRTEAREREMSEDEYVMKQLDMPDREGYTAFLIAAEMGQIPMMRHLMHYKIQTGWT